MTLVRRFLIAVAAAAVLAALAGYLLTQLEAESALLYPFLAALTALVTMQTLAPGVGIPAPRRSRRLDKTTSIGETLRVPFDVGGPLVRDDLDSFRADILKSLADTQHKLRELEALVMPLLEEQVTVLESLANTQQELQDSLADTQHKLRELEALVKRP
jgi:hypothetical protein